MLDSPKEEKGLLSSLKRRASELSSFLHWKPRERETKREQNSHMEELFSGFFFSFFCFCCCLLLVEIMMRLCGLWSWWEKRRCGYNDGDGEGEGKRGRTWWLRLGSGVERKAENSRVFVHSLSLLCQKERIYICDSLNPKPFPYFSTYN